MVLVDNMFLGILHSFRMLFVGTYLFKSVSYKPFISFLIPCGGKLFISDFSCFLRQAFLFFVFCECQSWNSFSSSHKLRYISIAFCFKVFFASLLFHFFTYWLFCSVLFNPHRLKVKRPIYWKQSKPISIWFPFVCNTYFHPCSFSLCGSVHLK